MKWLTALVHHDIKGNNLNQVRCAWQHNEKKVFSFSSANNQNNLTLFPKEAKNMETIIQRRIQQSHVLAYSLHPKVNCISEFPDGYPIQIY